MTDTNAIIISSDATIALDKARAKLAKLEAGTTRREQDALAGKVTAEDLAAHRDRVELARAVVSAAERAAATEATKIAAPEILRAALDEFLTDPALSVDHITDTITTARTAALAADQAIADRNTALVAWRDRLRSLGVPATGLTIDGNTISVRTIGNVLTVDVDGRAAAVTEKGTALVTDTLTARRNIPVLDSLRRDDTRSASIEHISVRLLRDAGGKRAGAILSTKDGSTPGSLRTLVSYGAAELVSGELPPASVSDQRAEATRAEQAERLAAAADDRPRYVS